MQFYISLYVAPPTSSPGNANFRVDIKVLKMVDDNDQGRFRAMRVNELKKKSLTAFFRDIVRKHSN